MEDCSLDLIFLITDRAFGFLIGDRDSFFQQFKLDFLDKVKAFIFLKP